MHISRRLFAVLLLAAIAIPASAADLLDKVRQQGTLRIAMEGTYPPFNFKDKKTGELSGYDVDVAKLLAAKLGLKPVFVSTEWSAILAGLGAGKYDVIISQVNITAKRMETFAFSDPYTYTSPQLVLRKSDSSVYAKLGDLKGKKVGVGQGTIFEQQAKGVGGIDVRSYPAAPENLADLAAGRIDAALNDSLMVAYLLNNSPLPLKPGPRMGNIERCGVTFQKGNPKFNEAINKALKDITADGSLRNASERWFGVDVSHP